MYNFCLFGLIIETRLSLKPNEKPEKNSNKSKNYSLRIPQQQAGKQVDRD